MRHSNQLFERPLYIVALSIAALVVSVALLSKRGEVAVRQQQAIAAIESKHFDDAYRIIDELAGVNKDYGFQVSKSANESPGFVRYLLFRWALDVGQFPEWGFIICANGVASGKIDDETLERVVVGVFETSEHLTADQMRIARERIAALQCLSRGRHER